ncbi:unnamed protein product [Vitrella brassicaformis CCMP3155]|uniref:ABC3 transporter permease C-terminal domain-containing protein n=2 Tax=Vitrella brassicaformis TaxID=1169539 RepID=A0A0G4GU86_VITBC|nr:unnamed protein product [Vitrella brassicaformis CCMP3155]|eukprot:CEM34393.1 unnamed protein product [Vitrella brassicaformis CCMP3155]
MIEEDVRKTANTWSGNLKITVTYALSQLGRNLRPCRIGVATVFLVVFFTALLQNAIQLSPIIFLKLAENDLGETDLLYTPLQSKTVAPVPPHPPAPGGGGGVGPSPPMLTWGQAGNGTDEMSIQFVDVSYLASELRRKHEKAVRGVVPRWVLQGRVVNARFPSRLNTTAVLLIADTASEDSVAFGRSFQSRPLAQGECYASGSVLRAMGLQPDRGERLRIELDLIRASSALSSSGISSPMSDPTNETTANDLTTNDAEAILRALGVNMTDSVVIDVPNATLTILQGLRQQGLPINGTVPLTIGNGTVVNVNVTEVLIGTAESVGKVPVPVDAILNATLPLLRQALTIEADFVPIVGTDAPEGKWPSALGNTLMIDAKYVLAEIITSFKQAFEDIQASILNNPLEITFDPTPFLTEALKVDLDRYALTGNVLLEDRIPLYMQEPRQQAFDITVATDRVAESIGIDYPISVTAPLQSLLVASQFVRLFLDNLFAAVVFVLVLLSIVLVYSLMLNDVEDKTYEFGMLRALGMRKQTLISMLLFQAMLFAIPGLSMGLLVAWLGGLIVTYFIADFSYAVFSYELHLSAILLGSSLGLIMPVIANIVPIRRALSKTLRDALDIYHAVVSEIEVTIIKLHRLGLSPLQLLASSILVIAGFITYYLIPLSFVMRSFVFFFSILNIILMGMMLGLVMVAQVFQPLLQQAFCWLIVVPFRADASLYVLVVKNLQGHGKRNAKTGLMFTVALTFLVFAGAIFALQGNNLAANVKQATGADVVVRASLWERPLYEEKLSSFLQGEMGKPKFEGSADERAQVDFANVANASDTARESGPVYRVVEGFSFITFNLQLTPLVFDVQLSNDALFPSGPVNLRGIQSNFFDVIFQEYFRPSQFQKGLDLATDDLVPSLFATYSVDPPVGPTEQLPDNRTARMRDAKGILSGFTTAGRNASDEVIQETTNKTRKADLSSSSLQPLKLLLPEGLRDPWSVKAGKQLTLRVKLDGTNGESLYYSTVVRAMVRKIPGTMFSSFSFIQGYPDAYTTEDAMLSLWDDTQRVSGLVRNSDPAIASMSDSDPSRAYAGFSVSEGSSLAGSQNSTDTEAPRPTAGPPPPSPDVPVSIGGDSDDTEPDGGPGGQQEGANIGSPVANVRAATQRGLGKASLYVRLVPNATIDERDFITNTIRSIMDDTHAIIDVRTLTETTQTAADLLQVFFAVCAIIAFVLAFFLLWTSSSANVRENMWEIGVLRACGLSKWQVVRVGVYESLSLTLSSILLGTVLGGVVAITLTVQFNLFSELPFVFLFPFTLYGFMVFLALVTAVVGPWVPTMDVAQAPVALILKGADWCS